MNIECNLLPIQKRRKQGLNVTIDLYPKASELYKAFNELGIIDRVQEIPQLGLIKVNSKLSKSRYDYILLQLYFHQIIKKNIQSCLRYTYNNVVTKKEFLPTCSEIEDDITIADIIQCLVLSYNIGHFYNTFTASRAAVMLAKEDETFLASIYKECASPRFATACEQIIQRKDYRRMHLLNTLIVLEKCNSESLSIHLAKEIIYAYIGEQELSHDSKLHYIFNLFRTVRNNAYVAYDLQIANTPFTLDLWNEKAIIGFFEEQLSEFNNRKTSNELVKSIQKMLDSTVYNENSNAICYYQISQKMRRTLINEYKGHWDDYYIKHFTNKTGCFNRTYRQRRDYDYDEILKITFENDYRTLAEDLLCSLDHTHNVRTGYYDRFSNEITVLLALKNTCEEKCKVAFKILKMFVKYLRQMGLESSDFRYILITKFFLYYLFGSRRIVIKPTIHESKCVFCTRGKSKRIEELQNIITSSIGNEDDNHEVQAIINKIRPDTKNDTCITVPGSTLVYTQEGKKLCEFDGIIIYPQRSDKQVILIEAKNTKEKPSYGKNCLNNALKNLGWTYDSKQIQMMGHDAYYEFSIE